MHNFFSRWKYCLLTAETQEYRNSINSNSNGDITAPFSFEKLLDFGSIGSVSKKKATAHMYIAHVANITMSFCELASTKFNFPFHELDCDWLLLFNSRAPAKFCSPLRSLPVITRFMTTYAIYWYLYWTSTLDFCNLIFTRISTLLLWSWHPRISICNIINRISIFSQRVLKFPMHFRS